MLARSSVLRTHRLFILAFAGYCCLTLVLLHSVVTNLATGVPHDIGDPLLTTTLLWWNTHTVPLSARWWDAPFFWPARGAIAFSDHRLGESLLAAPMIWTGLSPIVAYNVTLLLTFPLSAIAAHWLAYVLTRRHDASACCGLAYGFYPFRVAHVPHLELLASFGMPAALAALHRYRESGQRRWLIVFSAALFLQGICASYYMLFFSVLLTLWVAWFIDWNDVRRLMAIVVASIVAAMALLPIAVGYASVHASYGFVRTHQEIVRYSADVTSLATTSNLVALWGWTARWARSEQEIFPGVTIAFLACAGGVLAWRDSASAHDRLDRVARWLLGFAGCALVVAVCGWSLGTWRVELPGLQISSAAPHKPFSVAAAAVVIAVLLSSRLRGAWARRSPLVFYLIATVLLFTCTLGPEPTFRGHPILYKPPYDWLMALPLFSSIRAPARFAMVAMLALATAGALALTRFRLENRRFRVIPMLVIAGIVADSWIREMPIAKVPAVWPAYRAASFAAVIELPLGDLADDMAAMFRSTVHGRPVVNGSSGFEPAHYSVLKTAVAERDPAALDGMPPGVPLLAVIQKSDDRDGSWRRFLASTGRATPLADENDWLFVAVEPPPAPAPLCPGSPVAIAAAVDGEGIADVSALTDGETHTFWSTLHEQQVGDELVLDLGRIVRPCAVLLSLGDFRVEYPRKLIVETSVDGTAWTTVASRRTAGMAVRAALDDPIRAEIPVALAPRDGRYIRLRIDESHPRVPWIVTDVSVRSETRPE